MGQPPAETTRPAGRLCSSRNVKGHPGHKVFINQFGSERRMALALGVERLDEIAERIRGLMNVKAPQGLFDKLKMLPQLGALNSSFPKTVAAKDAPSKEIVRRDKFDLNYFPISNAGRTTAAASSRCPACTRAIRVPGKRNIGMYRMQVYDGRTTGMHWQRQKVAAEHYREAMRNAVSSDPLNQSEDGPKGSAAAARVAMMAESAGGATSIPEGAISGGDGGLPQISLGKMKGSRFEVAVAIGTDPATTFAAIVPRRLRSRSSSSPVSCAVSP